MQRWQLTTGLAALALAGAFVAPRLVGAPQVTPPPADVPTTDAVPVAPPIVAEATGHLTLDARLDHGAVLQGQAQERFLQITLTAPRDVGESFRRPVGLGVVMDVSGSMQARGRMDYAKKAARLLASSVEPDDTYALVTFNDEAHVVVPAASITDPWPVHQAIDAIWEGGGTNLYAGLEKGAAELRRSLRPDQVGRVVLLSDGYANKGITDPETMGRFVSALASQGVTVSAVGLGTEYNEDLLQRLADLGGGTYDYVDDPKELSQVFADELERSASVVARGTRVTVTLPPGVEGLEVIGWDAETTPEGFSVWMGDVYAGDARKIIARVRITGSAAPAMDVSKVTVSYTDMIDQRAATGTVLARAQSTTDPAQVAASIDRTVAVEAARAWGNEVLVQSTRVYVEGDRAGAAALARRSQEILREAASAYSAPVLLDDAALGSAQEQVYDRYAPTAPEAQGSVKRTKESFNVQSRSVIQK